MIYVSKTFSYMRKSFWLLALISLVPALLLGLFVRPMGFISFVPDYASTTVTSYADIAWLIFDRYATVYVYPIVLIFVTLVICMSLALSVIEKHFRTGRLMFKAPLQDINSSLFPTLKMLSVITAAYLLYKFILSGLVTLLHFLISGSGAPNTVTIVIVAVVVVALFFLMMFFAVPVLLWTPLMLTFGYSFADAFIAASRMASKAFWKLFLALVLPFVAVILVQCVLELLPLHIAALKAVAAVMYLFVIMYMSALMMVAMFDLTELERRDVKDKYYSKGN